MKPSTRTPEGQPNHCPVCGNEIRVEASWPTGDVPCPCCGHLLWFPAVAGIHGLNFFVGDGRIFELAVSTKLAAIDALIGKLCELGHVQREASPSVVKALMHREQLGSTGLGRGVAVPHAKHDAVEWIVGIIGYVPGGVDFGSLDGEAVTKVFLLLSPPDKPGDHLRALAPGAVRSCLNTVHDGSMMMWRDLIPSVRHKITDLSE